MDTDAVQRSRIAVQRIAFEEPKDGFTLLVRRPRDTRHHRKTASVRIQLQHRSLFDLQKHIALEEKRTSTVIPLWNHHASALRATENRRLQHRRVVMNPVALCSRAPHVEGTALFFCPECNTLVISLRIFAFQYILRIRPQAEERANRTAFVFQLCPVQHKAAAAPGFVQPLRIQKDRGAARGDKQHLHRQFPLSLHTRLKPSLRVFSSPKAFRAGGIYFSSSSSPRRTPLSTA